MLPNNFQRFILITESRVKIYPTTKYVKSLPDTRSKLKNEKN